MTIVKAPLIQSHPVWVRGLKHKAINGSETLMEVAPRVGAWIETLNGSARTPRKRVAPRVGAWIETAQYAIRDLYAVVAPRVGAWIETFGCSVAKFPYIQVAPRVGAWIET